jgi:hypothetical protein
LCLQIDIIESQFGATVSGSVVRAVTRHCEYAIVDSSASSAWRESSRVC